MGTSGPRYLHGEVRREGGPTWHGNVPGQCMVFSVTIDLTSPYTFSFTVDVEPHGIEVYKVTQL